MSTNSKREGIGIEYKVNNYVFIVTPVFNENSEKSIYEILLSLMEKDSN